MSKITGVWARPILFSGPMVRAILAGWKTQTRRIVQSPAKTMQREGMTVIQNRPAGDAWYGDYVWSMRDRSGYWMDYKQQEFLDLCPFGQPGDELWVKETWGLHRYGDLTDWCRDSLVRRSGDELRASWEVAYRADAEPSEHHWRSSIFMPRWASRIRLRVTDVRVEPLADISEEDAKAESVDVVPGRTAREGFFDLWDRIHGEGSHQDNPWVWVVSFKLKRRGA